MNFSLKICLILLSSVYLVHSRQTQFQYLASDGRFGKGAADLAKVLLDYLLAHTCSNNDTRRCFHNDWKRRDNYCQGYAYGTRFSFSAWYGGKCFCCARCKKDDISLCLFDNWQERDRKCTGRLYNKRFSYNAAFEKKKCYCCDPR